MAPSGFVPSATALVGVWAFFLVDSFVVVECLFNARQTQNTKSGNPGIAAAAKSAMGEMGEAAVFLLLVLLTEATLVSQISRAGTLLFPQTGVCQYYRIVCSIVALSVAAKVDGPSSSSSDGSTSTIRKFIPTMNSLLTIIFCIMAIVLFGAGAPAADWSHLATSGSGWSNVPAAIPTFLHFLIYGEILPNVCQLLRYQVGPIRLAIALGSVLPLGLEVGWAALGIALLPSITTEKVIGDPVNAMLAAGGPIQVPLFILAGAAILTTIIGSYLALNSAFEDLFPPRIVEHEKKDRGWIFNLVATTSIVAPSLVNASISPDLFLQAIDFAGSYPVVLLWGLAPPTKCILQRRQQ